GRSCLRQNCRGPRVIRALQDRLISALQRIVGAALKMRRACALGPTGPGANCTPLDRIVTPAMLKKCWIQFGRRPARCRDLVRARGRKALVSGFPTEYLHESLRSRLWMLERLHDRPQVVSLASWIPEDHRPGCGRLGRLSSGCPARPCGREPPDPGGPGWLRGSWHRSRGQCPCDQERPDQARRNGRRFRSQAQIELRRAPQGVLLLQQFPACDFRPENTLVLISHFANSLRIMLSRIPYLTTWANGVARHGTCSRCSNSRPCECDSSWIAHFDGDRLIRHHRDVEKGLRCGLLGPEPARFRRSSACFGS